MRSQFVSALLGAALLVSSAVQSAAQMEQKLVADIPFEFQIEGRSYPAGPYGFTPTTAGPNVLALTNAQGRIVHMFITHSIQDLPSDQPPRLVFNRYGNTHYLSRVYSLNSARGWFVRPSASEREALARANQAQPATVAARR